MGHTAKIISINKVTHDVLQITTEKPQDIKYSAGQAADISINKAGWENELRAFTFTSLPDDDHLQFVIKTYNDHEGVTNQLTTLKPGDELIIGEVFGDIAYKGEGLFIAGGAGITPFLAIFKVLQRQQKLGNNILLFANKSKADIILEEQLSSWLGDNVIHVLSNEHHAGYKHGFITKDMIAQALGNNLDYVYLCGPPQMMEMIESFCSELGISSDKLVKEAF